MAKIKDKQINFALIFMIFLLLGIISLINIQNFYTSHHNIDIGQNIRYLNCEFGINLIDVGSDFRERTGDELYIMGSEGVRKAFLSSIIIAFLMGFLLLYLIREKTNFK